ncbi:MAG: hypothetical protein ACJAVK_001437 [Akkermansiaceae bacterium]
MKKTAKESLGRPKEIDRFQSASAGGSGAVIEETARVWSHQKTDGEKGEEEKTREEEAECGGGHLLRAVHD